MGRNGESGAFGLAAARGGVAAAGVGARFARFGTGIGIGAGTSNVASEPLRDRTEGDAVDVDDADNRRAPWWSGTGVETQ